MEQSKLVQVLKTLSLKEWSQLKSYLANERLKENSPEKKLFNEFWAYRKRVDGIEFNKEELFKRIYGNQPFKTKQITDLQSKLMVIIEQFLMLEEIKKNSFLKAKIYGERSLNKLFIQSLNTSLESLYKIQSHTSKLYLDGHRLSYMSYFFPQADKFKSGTAKLQSATLYLDKYYVINKLKYACELHYRSLLTNEIPEIKSLDQTIKQSRVFKNEGILFELYPLLIELVKRKEDNNLYLSIKKLYFKNISKIDVESRRIILVQLINYCSYRRRKYHDFFSAECFDLYDFGLKQDILIYNKHLTDTSYLNIIALACSLKHFDWVNEFIIKYSVYLDSNTKDDVRCFSEAYLFFHKGFFEETIISLENTNFSNIPYHIRGRALQLRAYYKNIKEEFDKTLAIQKADAFRKYLEKQKKHLNSKQILAYQNYIKMINGLIHLTLIINLTDKNINNLIARIKTKKEIHLRAWLISEAERLKEPLSSDQQKD